MPVTASTSASATLRLLCLGDSYTIGEGVDAAGRWPDQLAANLHRQAMAVDEPEIVACTGWTTDELAAAMDRRGFSPPYDLVTLLIGVNNQYRGRDLANYRDEFHVLLARAAALAGHRPDRVVVVSIPDWGATRFGLASGRDRSQIACDIDAFNAANAAIAAEFGAGYADVTAASRDGGDCEKMLAGDGLHPSAAMYTRWLETILPAAQAALGKP